MKLFSEVLVRFFKASTGSLCFNDLEDCSCRFPCLRFLPLSVAYILVKAVMVDIFWALVPRTLPAPSDMKQPFSAVKVKAMPTLLVSNGFN